MSDKDKTEMLEQQADYTNDENKQESPELIRKRLLKPVHEDNFPEHVGDEDVCTIDTLLQKILDDDKQYDLSKYRTSRPAIQTDANGNSATRKPSGSHNAAHTAEYLPVR